MKSLFKIETNRIVLILIMSVFLLSGCAHSFELVSCMPDKQFGFFGGLWYGMIAPFSFIISLFTNKYVMYACNNTGGWYDFGFVLGTGILFGGGSKAAS